MNGNQVNCYFDQGKEPSETRQVLLGQEIKVYRKRWIMLVLFILGCATNMFQYLQYCIIADTVVNYYGVSYIAVDWTALVVLLVYIPFFFPGIYILDKTGLRTTLLVGMTGTCAAAWIKSASVSPDRFWVLLLGQGIIGVSQVFIIGLPPRLAAVWFGPNEVSSACFLGITGVQIGIAMGFLIPPLFVDGTKTQDDMGAGLHNMSVAMAIFNTILLLIIFIFFQANPPVPPSDAQLKMLQNREDNFLKSTKTLLINKEFLIFLLVYGIHAGVTFTISVLLNQIVLETHPNGAVVAGRLGLCKILAATASTVTWGIILDKYKQFKKTLFTTYILSVLGLMTFILTVDKQLSIAYPGVIIAGLLLDSVYAVGYEIGAELTYPVPEGTSGGIISATANIFAIIFTHLYSFLFTNFSNKLSYLVMFLLLLTGLFIVMRMRLTLRRQTLQIMTTIT